MGGLERYDKDVGMYSYMRILEACVNREIIYDTINTNV
jgi:hypothetical protein